MLSAGEKQAMKIADSVIKSFQGGAASKLYASKLSSYKE